MIVDIDFRWVKRTAGKKAVYKPFDGSPVEFIDERIEVLQFRKQVQVNNWSFQWTDWQDVPVVEE